MDVLGSSVLTEDGIIDGYVCIEEGVVASIEEGVPPQRPVAAGLVVPPLVNAHTHCADAGLKIPQGLTIEELVTPPNGLKHMYLRALGENDLIKNMTGYAETSRSNGIGTFIDFREGGEKGCIALRKACPEAVILGRPLSKEYDQKEVSRILKVADGIGLSSISDVDHAYIEKVADQTREQRKIFSIHASERVREDIDFILSLDPAFVVHMVEATDSDLLKCAEAEVPIVVCVRSNRYFKKTPPLKRMSECGVDIAMGTDNAMLCSPDMRAEANAFKEVLLSQGGSAEDILSQMITNGRKILYPNNKIHVSAGMTAELTVFPLAGPHDGILSSRDPVFRYKPKKRR
ncbi:5-methylthioadenosine/S-adenosylhomocysteine deaminase [Candidatus Methanoplasma termitum]|uniref:MtaD1 protein n=1 Tax=Candidatus Methanoplasma termitum TaxID=1577791 RepID=A0A0A7LBR7_9ARCH|nr:amidohydrolase family protein [Candidatus Methanoplasma termitum]AIZ56509.1 5-methylthioadenosine/S-adenosylhomocysteine deaminase [Candidatus Methanoplasma termitum]